MSSWVSSFLPRLGSLMVYKHGTRALAQSFCSSCYWVEAFSKARTLILAARGGMQCEQRSGQMFCSVHPADDTAAI